MADLPGEGGVDGSVPRGAAEEEQHWLSTVAGVDVDGMVGRLFLSTRAARSRFWVLLVLAAVIAAAGVVGDSTATVIGAMIVAPLMTPILGTALAVVLADRRKILENVALVLIGAAVVVAIGYLLGLSVPEPVVAETNSQVASRVSPKLIDLVAALATGVVGAFAQVRKDVSDTLPGVAIAISLVPPLSVVGLTLESGEPRQAAGALLLFGTNVAAIIGTGTVVLLGYRVRAAAVVEGRSVGRFRPLTAAVVGAFVVAVAVPLSLGSYRLARDQQIVATARPASERWAGTQSLQIVSVTMGNGQLTISAAGPKTDPDSTALRRALDEAGLSTVPVRLSVVMGGTRDLPRGEGR